MCLKFKHILSVSLVSVLLFQEKSHAIVDSGWRPRALGINSFPCGNLLKAEDSVHSVDGIVLGFAGIDDFFNRLRKIGYMNDAHHGQVMPRWWAAATAIEQVFREPVVQAQFNRSLRKKRQKLEAQFLELNRLLIESADLARVAKGQTDWVGEIQPQGAAPGSRLEYALPPRALEFLKSYMDRIEFWLKRLGQFGYSDEIADLRSPEKHASVIETQMKSYWRANLRFMLAGLLPELKKVNLITVESVEFYEFEFFVNDDRSYLYFVNEIYLPSAAAGWGQPPHLRAILSKVKNRRRVEPHAHFYLVSIEPLSPLVTSTFLNEARHARSLPEVSPAVFVLKAQ